MLVAELHYIMWHSYIPPRTQTHMHTHKLIISYVRTSHSNAQFLIHAYIHTYIHTYVHTYMHAYIHTCMHAGRHTCVRMYVHTYIHTYVHTYIHTYIRTYINTYIHTYVRMYVHTYIHTYICTYLFHVCWLAVASSACTYVRTSICTCSDTFVCTQVSAILDQVKVGGVSAIPGLETQLKGLQVVRSANDYPLAADGPFIGSNFTSYIYVCMHTVSWPLRNCIGGWLVDACTVSCTH